MGQISHGKSDADGMNKRVLPGRTSIILTQDQAYDPENDAVLVIQQGRSLGPVSEPRRRIFTLLEAVRF